jgi:hypothetical protein
MKPRIGFIVSIFLLLLTTSFLSKAQDCRKVDLKVDITDSRDGKGGSIKVSAKDTKEPFILHLIGKGNGRGIQDNQLNVTTGSIENIKPGKYELTIHYTDATYCTETRKVTIN